jgi:hypothetical protein
MGKSIGWALPVGYSKYGKGPKVRLPKALRHLCAKGFVFSRKAPYFES